MLLDIRILEIKKNMLVEFIYNHLAQFGQFAKWFLNIIIKMVVIIAFKVKKFKSTYSKV